MICHENKPRPTVFLEPKRSQGMPKIIKPIANVHLMYINIPFSYCLFISLLKPVNPGGDFDCNRHSFVEAGRNKC